MLLKTSNGKTYTVDWVDTIATTGNIFLQLPDPRPLPAIAAEFDGLSWLRREDENQGNKDFPGYNVLLGIQRVAPGICIISIGKEAA